MVDGVDEEVTHPLDVQLLGYVDASATATDQRRVEAHLETCATCARVVDELHAVVARLLLVTGPETGTGPEAGIRPAGSAGPG